MDSQKATVLLDSHFSIFEQLDNHIMGRLHFADWHVGSGIIRSAGKRFAKYWSDSNFDDLFPGRTKKAFAFPTWIKLGTRNVSYYPSAAQDRFWDWFAGVYVSTHLKDYLLEKVQSGELELFASTRILDALVVK